MPLDSPQAKHRLLRLADLVTTLRAEDNPIIQARHAAELQRLTGWILRDAISHSRDEGLSWRDIARRTEIPLHSLHSQYEAGGPILVHDPDDDTDN
jgi:hypothetical protein